MKKAKKRSTTDRNRNHIKGVQTEMNTIIPAMTADENNARLDHIFDRLYKLRGPDLKGLTEEIEKEEGQKFEAKERHLFRVPFKKAVSKGQKTH